MYPCRAPKHGCAEGSVWCPQRGLPWFRVLGVGRGLQHSASTMPIVETFFRWPSFEGPRGESVLLGGPSESYLLRIQGNQQ